MSKNRKRSPPESQKAKKDDTRFTQMYHSQLTSKAFFKLSNTAKIIYIYMREYATNKYEFKYPRRIYTNICTPPTFNKIIDELVQNGFIITIISGKSTGNENIYRFSDKWQNIN